jgi:putative oxidoreductase
MAARPATIRPKPLNVPVLDNNPQSTLERTTTVPIFNGDSLAQVLRPVISPQRMLGWSLGIVYLWFGALKLAHLSPVLELIRRTSPLLATAPFYNALALSELAIGLMLLAGVWRRWTAASAVLHLMGTFSVVFSSPQTAFRPRFPILTMEGEFVVKNIVLLAAAGTLWLLAGERVAHRPGVALSRPSILSKRAAMTTPAGNFPGISEAKTCGSNMNKTSHDFSWSRRQQTCNTQRRTPCTLHITKRRPRWR